MTTKKAARVNALTTFALAAFSIAIFNAYADGKPTGINILELI
ncbi:hypothetical protein [Streptococcus suis]|nr:hypothetical protein [Streptococcus suis]